MKKRQAKKANVIRKELEDKKNQLRKEYANIKKDKGQLQAMKDWESTVGDGL